jgi:hypothetical protein
VALRNRGQAADFFERLFFFSVLGFKLRAYTLSHATRPFLREGPMNYLPWLASNCDPPDPST